MKQITLAISEAKSVQSSQWNHCIYETWWDNNCCQKWRFIVKYGTHLAEKGGGKWLHEVSQGMMQLARLLLYLREKSSTRTSAMGLEHFIKPEHFDLIIASVKSLCSFDHSGKTSAIAAGPFLKELCCHIDWKRSQTKGQTVLQTNQ